ncbi:MinD/ParA family protein [Mycobacterium vicinigordonae]|uniref:MinD/ParA family protein n=1 Tax=Mycobacterium vicinigordonae TaxID=1719132 RepID=A0A7D6I537_9MYCO|nr:MinD/ParA family protein [Mycobacterium vicinigordonae]QLL06016.1 MinD/ParA family protein [Mycobacterium vicinigordonae]
MEQAVWIEPEKSGAPAVSEPESRPAVEVSVERDWEPDLPKEPDPSGESSAPDEPAHEEPAPGELDDIELRAAALLEQMEAKRAQASAAAQQPEAETAADPAPEFVVDDWLSTNPVDDNKQDNKQPESIVPETDSLTQADESPEPRQLPEPPVVQEPPMVPDSPAPTATGAEAGTDEAGTLGEEATEWRWTDFLRDAEAPSESVVDHQPAEPTAVTETESNVHDPSAATRRPVVPPWQMPNAATPTDIDRTQAAPHEPPPGAPTQQAPVPPGPPARPGPGSRRGAPPPFPPPPPPGPFPPPPWWPGPPPGRGVPPAARQPPTRLPAGQPPGSGRPPGPPPAPVGPPPSYQPFQVPPPIDEAEVANLDRFAPPSGWRRAVHKATGGHLNPGASRKERRHEHLLAEIRQPIVGDFRIAVLSIKGGVGKTTTTFGLGSALATVRHDRVIAVDANPDRGTLGERVGDLSTRSTVRDLLADPNINRYADVRNHTLMATSRLEVLASEQDPAVSEIFGAEDYRRTIEILRHFYNIILTDCGTGIMHSAMSAVLDLAHSIVLVSSPAIDAARSASATLDWLVQHGHSGLVREAHVVLSASRPGSAALKLDKVYEHFQTRCRSIHLIPFDPHLAEGADVDFDRLRPATRQAYLELAGSVSENFGRLRGVREQV